jgi:hypothetical protein
MLRGLLHCAQGGQFDETGHSANGGRRLVGWSATRWVLRNKAGNIGAAT